MTARTAPLLGVRAMRALQVVGAGVLVAVLVVLITGRGPGEDDKGRAATTSATGAGTAGPSTTPRAAERSGARAVPGPTGAQGEVRSVSAALRPVRIAIPAIGVDSQVTSLGIAGDGTIEVPEVPARAGWLETSPAPGQRGPAVIAGHVDSTSGPAVFYRLRELRAGDAVIVTRRDGTAERFTVDGLGVYPKDEFPTQATYGPVPGPALRLITCGGTYVKSRGGYLDNVVVFAT